MKIKILDIKIDPFVLNQADSQLSFFFNQKKPTLICTPNTEIVMLAQRNSELKEILNNKSKLNLPDGIGILWAARFNTLWTPKTPVLREFVIFLQWLLTIIMIPLFPNFFNTPIKERVSGSDFAWLIAEFACKNKYKLFLLGGAPTVAQRAALELQTNIYDLRIAGVHSGGIEDTEEIIAAINKSKADILLVAFGAPKQEKWLNKNLEKTCCKIGIGVGGTFDFIAGTKKRAPKWMRRIGLEWLFRLVIEPKRIIRQIVLPKFMLLILINRIMRHEKENK